MDGDSSASSVVRKCVGCFLDHPAESMIRVVRTSNGCVFVEPVGHEKSQLGRGAYLCAERRCIEKALHRKGKRAPLSHWLKAPLTEEIIAQVKACAIP